MDNFLDHIEAIVGDGKAVISGENYNIVAIVKDVIGSGRSASFYLSAEQARAFRQWYWTPERIRTSKIEAISSEEKAKIESELGIENIGSFRCSRLRCQCGSTYGAYEFLKQGMDEHGANAVKAIFNLKNSTFFRVNPSFALKCANCDQLLRDGGIEYGCDRYGGCSYQEPQLA